MRIVPEPIKSYPWYLRPFFWNQRRKYGRVLDAALLWARSPRLFLGVAALYGAIERKRSPIDPALRALVTVRVSQVDHCRFCVDINSATVLRRGVAEPPARAGRGARATGARHGRAGARGRTIMTPWHSSWSASLIAAMPTVALAQPREPYWGPGMMGGGGWFHMLFGWLMMLIFLGIVVLLVVLAVRWLGSSEHSPFRAPPSQGSKRALDILKERLARGEIDVAEFEERRRALGED